MPPAGAGHVLTGTSRFGAVAGRVAADEAAHPAVTAAMTAMAAASGRRWFKILIAAGFFLGLMDPV